jgi:predicted PurR-regulated permease PerM
MGGNSTQLYELGRRAVSGVAGLGISVLQFVAATLLAAFFLANADKMRAGALLFCRRLAKDRGDEMLDTAVATIRSVTVGVLGIAFIQGVLSGAGMVVVGVPGAGVWALLVMILTIAQLPALIVLLPVIIWVFSVESTAVASIFAVWSIAVGMSDAVLKPLLLGRGVATPMIVVLIGAIGGMLMSGIIGLFVGAVIFTLGYTLVVAWLDMAEDAAESDAPASATD